MAAKAPGTPCSRGFCTFAKMQESPLFFSMPAITAWQNPLLPPACGQAVPMRRPAVCTRFSFVPSFYSHGSPCSLFSAMILFAIFPPTLTFVHHMATSTAFSFTAFTASTKASLVFASKSLIKLTGLSKGGFCRSATVSK